MSSNNNNTGTQVGMAVGDALGTTIEFQPPPVPFPVSDIVGGGKFDLLPGQWTDDTSMALCLAESLIETKGFSAADQLKRYLEWYEDGKLSSNGRCFDIGIGTRMALMKFQKTGTDQPASSDEKARAGNGSLMRLSPAVLMYAHNHSDAIDKAAASSKTTHAAGLAVDACRYFAGLLLGALGGCSKDDILSQHFTPTQLRSPDGKSYWKEHPLAPEIDEIALGSFKTRNPPEICGTGFVVKSLEAVLWAFYHTDNFKDGLLKVVNLGDDADTTGAIYGQLAGAFYGVSAIPSAWRAKIALSPLIEAFALELLSFSTQLSKAESDKKPTASAAYDEVQKCYKHLELGFRPVLRRSSPCKAQFQTLDEFDDARRDFIAKYNSEAPGCSQKSALLAHYETLMEDERRKLALRLGR